MTTCLPLVSVPAAKCRDYLAFVEKFPFKDFSTKNVLWRTETTKFQGIPSMARTRASWMLAWRIIGRTTSTLWFITFRSCSFCRNGLNSSRWARQFPRVADLVGHQCQRYSAQNVYGTSIAQMWWLPCRSVYCTRPSRWHRERHRILRIFEVFFVCYFFLFCLAGLGVLLRSFLTAVSPTRCLLFLVSWDYSVFGTFIVGLKSIIISSSRRYSIFDIVSVTPNSTIVCSLWQCLVFAILLFARCVLNCSVRHRLRTVGRRRL